MKGTLNFVITTIIAWVIPRLLEQFVKPGQDKKFPWVRWCMGQFIAAAISGYLIGLMMVMQVKTPGDVVCSLIYGTAIGISQWFALQKYLTISPLWILFSVVGWQATACCIAAGMPHHAAWAAGGLGIGCFQWLLLRRVCSKALWWIPANVLGYLPAHPVGFTVGAIMVGSQVDLGMAWVISIGIIGLFASLVSGFTLSQLPIKAAKKPTDLQQSITQESATS